MADFLLSLAYGHKRLFCRSGCNTYVHQISSMYVKVGPGAANFQNQWNKYIFTKTDKSTKFHEFLSMLKPQKGNLFDQHNNNSFSYNRVLALRCSGPHNNGQRAETDSCLICPYSTCLLRQRSALLSLSSKVNVAHPAHCSLSLALSLFSPQRCSSVCYAGQTLYNQTVVHHFWSLLRSLTKTVCVCDGVWCVSVSSLREGRFNSVRHHSMFCLTLSYAIFNITIQIIFITLKAYSYGERSKVLVSIWKMEMRGVSHWKVTQQANWVGRNEGLNSLQTAC